MFPLTHRDYLFFMGGAVFMLLFIAALFYGTGKL